MLAWWLGGLLACWLAGWLSVLLAVFAGLLTGWLAGQCIRFSLFLKEMLNKKKLFVNKENVILRQKKLFF